MAFIYTSQGSGEPPGDYNVVEHAQRYLSAIPGAISGQGGHNQTYTVACVLIQGFALSTEDAWRLLLEYNQRCQPAWTEKELWHKLESAQKADPPAGGKGSMAKGHANSYTSYYPVEEAYQFETFLKACFEPDDIVSIAPGFVPEGSERAIPEHSGVNLFTRDQWMQKSEESSGIHRVFSSKDGLYVRINPVELRSNGTDKSVTSLRHSLIESDKMQKEDQLRILKTSGLPISALIDSGGNSIHAWVKVEAENLQQYHERREKLWASLKGFEIDQANKNPSRYSRCPGGLRGSGTQKLLAVNLGPKSYAEWEEKQSSEPQIQCAADFCLVEEPDPPLLIEGLLYKGSKMIIAGPSKSRKSWNLIDLAIAMSTGESWCGFSTKKSRVLYVNLEIQSFSYRKRIKHVAKGRGIHIQELTNFHTWTLRGQDVEITQLVEKILKHTEASSYDLIIIDPIYKTYGDRQENSNTEMAQVLAALEKLALKAEAAVAIAAHFPKGNVSGRDAMDRISGASVFGRDPDVLLTMTTHEMEDAYTITPIVRDLPPVHEFVVQWNGFRFQRTLAHPGALAGKESSKTHQQMRNSEAGSYRDMFSHMPPLRHSNDPSESQVINYIAKVLDEHGKDPQKAQSTFNMIRNSRRKIIIYDNTQKLWKGSLYDTI
ncbi:MAG: AAA family ATPase [Opitutales bacterium]|nr:AAA family ATPase [Opitutales bacterium]